MEKWIFKSLAFILTGLFFLSLGINAEAGNNIAYGKRVFSSSSENFHFLPSFAVDQSLISRWSSEFSDPQWFYVDLGEKHDIERVVINWETAYGKEYKIQVSDDAIKWVDVYSKSNGMGGVDDLHFSGLGRYVRIYATKRGTVWGYSFYELEVYGKASDIPLVSMPATSHFIWPDRHYMAKQLADPNSGFTSDTIRKIGARNEFVLRDAVDKNINSLLREGNQKIRIIGYVNAMWIWPDHNDFIWSYDYINENHPEWFLKDAYNKRIYGSHWGYMLDIGNPAYQDYISESAMNALSNGINGIYIDDAHEIIPNFYGFSGWPVNPRTGRDYKNDEWKQDAYNLIQKAHDRVRSSYPDDPSRLLLYNGYISGWQGKYFMPVSDGAQSEGFIHSYWESASNYRSEGIWKQEIDDLIAFQKQGKVIFATCGANDGDINTYCYSSYLLGKGSGSYYNYAGHGQNYWQGFNVNLGRPLNDYYIKDDVFQRDFSYGKVFVNPSQSSYSISLGSGMYLLKDDGYLSSDLYYSFVLGPHKGSIFLKQGTNYCGDGQCNGDENSQDCPQDCGNPGPVCGDGVCESGENIDSCPSDCFIASDDNIALNKPVFASSSENSGLSPYLAADGRMGTRWSSLSSDNQWIYVDLGRKYDLKSVVLRWEAAYAREYKVQVSDDGISWYTVYSKVNGIGGLNNLSVSGSGRYVRILGVRRGTGWGYSLYEFEVYGDVYAPKNIALGRRVVASSAPYRGFEESLVADGNDSSRWSSAKTDWEWIYVDLGKRYRINKVVLKWADAYGKDYQIKVNDIGSNWTPIFKRTGFSGGTDTIEDISGTGRYISVQGLKRSYPKWWGYSLSEFEVYGTPSDSEPVMSEN